VIVSGFKPVGWVAGIGAAALCCYMLSLQVASERSELASLERQIVHTRQDIRSLQTELGTRGRLQQLEQWNAEVLALSAPVADQFLESNVSLARFDVQQPSLDDRARLRMAAADTAQPPAAPAAPAAAPTAQPALRLASAPVAVQNGTASPTRPLVRRASLVVDPAPAPAPPPAPTPARSASRPAAPADSGASPLLDDSTLRDLGAQSRSERGGGARN
jgi:hypothetical protein